MRDKYVINEKSVVNYYITRSNLFLNCSRDNFPLAVRRRDLRCHCSPAFDLFCFPSAPVAFHSVQSRQRRVRENRGKTREAQAPKMSPKDVRPLQIVVVTAICALMRPAHAIPFISSDKEPAVEFIVLHNNDMHARFEQTSQYSTACHPAEAINNKCYGGFARVSALVKKYRQAADNGGPKTLYLNAGDTYTGTPWFTVYKDRIVSAFLNALKPDAMVWRMGMMSNILKMNAMTSFLQLRDFAKYDWVKHCNFSVAGKPWAGSGRGWPRADAQQRHVPCAHREFEQLGRSSALSNPLHQTVGCVWYERTQYRHHRLSDAGDQGGRPAQRSGVHRWGRWHQVSRQN